MAKVRHLAQNTPLPEWFLDEVQEFLSTYASPNFALTILNPTTLQIAAAAGNAQVSVAIGNPADTTVFGWRWNSANVTAAAPGTLITGDNDVYVISTSNGPYLGTAPELDTGTVSFGLMVLPPGTPPSGTGSQAYYRKVGVATWSGSAFTDVRPTVGGLGLQKHAATHNPGGADALNWSSIAQTEHLSGTLAARPAAAGGNQGFLYFATDASGGTLYLNMTGSAWAQIASGLTQAPTAHAAAHLAGGADAIAWTTVHGAGTLAARPTAGSTNAGYIYFATDVNSGTLYRSDGAAWTKAALGATETPSMTGIAAAILLSGTYASRPAAAGGNAGFYYLATDQNGGSLYQSTGAAWLEIGLRPGLVHPAQMLGLTAVEGVVPGHGTGDVQTDPQLALKVTLNSGFILNIAPGYGVVQGDDAAQQGMYAAVQAAGTTLTLGTHAPATNPRIDAIIARYNDPQYTGRTPTGLVYEQVVGTETSGATLANLNGAPGKAGGPAFPASALLLCYVLWATTDTTGPSSGNVTGGDARKIAGPAIWGEDSHRYRLGIDGSGVLGLELVL